MRWYFLSGQKEVYIVISDLNRNTHKIKVKNLSSQ